ncbi:MULTISPECIES: 2Fe-2S iron-sulfur cluster-binding protein [Streptomyces]|uniref:(2Fe-2S)-binding protein n=1 Tax=Streptomyces yunnanensis TaxID=156453 RepID=A0ABY8AJI6_9ACTN|nr:MULTISPECIES: 2Fe-2S iron-sulfur cluster-binding protein [Streptomyces]WEB45148.1 (2Fe-2S)-binding protein [Streptomyces yunnanensis]
MAQVTFSDANGHQSVLDVPSGTSVMEAAVDNGIDGIDGQCGGRLICATCHVFVEAVEGPAPPGLDADEDDMLDYTAVQRRPNSRLSCRLVMGEGPGVLVVGLPDTQT